ncbi:thiamine-phosphate kinase [Polymorphobacter sp.]|uniref:thiamine-phosphate kinase n=1 Tax=Polymorphobacter sp. TaxID=1909290 RepID=UPI003F6E751B
MAERDLIARLLAPLATHAAARGLADDAAVWAPPLGRDLVFSHDMMVEGVHFLGSDSPADIGWKLVASNASDLAAMAARPAGCLLALGLAPTADAAWQQRFVAGLGQALAAFDLALWGGDTSSSPVVTLGLTVIGHVEPGQAPARSTAQPGDTLWLSGTIGDAGLGLAMAKGELPPDPWLLKRHHRPTPRLALGRSLAGRATAAMDVSDGLLIDATRLAAASQVALHIDLDLIPLSPQARAHALTPLAAATSGDDYELLFTAPPHEQFDATPIGYVAPGTCLHLTAAGRPVPLPAHLGWEHTV